MELTTVEGNGSVTFDRNTTASNRQDQGHADKQDGNRNKQSIKDAAYEFSQNTTAHGIPRAVAAESIPVRIIWLLICGLCWGVFLWQAATSVKNYFDYKVTYDISVEFRVLKFPAVTVCNINPLRQSKLGELGEEYRDQLGFLDFDYETDGNETSFDWNEDVADEHIDETWWDSEEEGDYDEYDPEFASEVNLTTIMSLLPDDVRESIGHNKTDLIQDCTFNGVKCSPHNFSLVLNPKYGNCYSFNVGANDTEIASSSRPGPSKGLQLTLFIEQDEYLQGFTESAGAVVLIHPHKIVPFPEEQGNEIPPGFSTSIGVRLSHIQRLGGKYGNCSEKSSGEELLYDGFDYSTEACRRTCFQREVMESCNCYDPTMPHDGDNLLACSEETDTNTCWSTISKQFNADQLGCTADCPQACSVDSYKETISMSLWPSEAYDFKLFSELSKRSRKINEQLDSLDESRRNLVRLKVYYQELNYESIREKPALDTVALLSNLGGLIGLYIGASVISVFEFLEFLVTIFFLATKKARKAGQISNMPT